jgi:hypothetical protein
LPLNGNRCLLGRPLEPERANMVIRVFIVFSYLTQDNILRL